MENLITIQCTNPGLWENHLTSGKTYTAQLDEDDTYKVIDDSGEPNYYFRYRFEVVTINKINMHKSRRKGMTITNSRLAIREIIKDMSSEEIKHVKECLGYDKEKGQ